MKSHTLWYSNGLTRLVQFRRYRLMLAAVLAMMLAEQVGAANLAPLGDGILGVNDAIDADAGTPRLHAGLPATSTTATCSHTSTTGLETKAPTSARTSASWV